MKKICSILTLGVLMSFYVLAQEELIPSPESIGGMMFDHVQDETRYINADSMKKADKINSVIQDDEVEFKKSPKIKIDAKAVLHQRALDYSTNKSNTLQLPVGF